MQTILPTKGQLKFLDWEFGLFFHFGIRTFCPEHHDWDMAEMSPERFVPSSLDCEEWLSAAKQAGAKYAIMTSKHHDGFALWPSAYTDFSVKRSPWKNGSGDVVKEFTDACRKLQLGCGLYYSPADFSAKRFSKALRLATRQFANLTRFIPTVLHLKLHHPVANPKFQAFGHFMNRGK